MKQQRTRRLTSKTANAQCNNNRLAPNCVGSHGVVFVGKVKVGIRKSARWYSEDLGPQHFGEEREGHYNAQEGRVVAVHVAAVFGNEKEAVCCSMRKCGVVCQVFK